MSDLHHYDDIIDMPRHVSKRHPQMPIANRAAQFTPFAALTGHKEALVELERLTDKKKILDENKKVQLDASLQEIMMYIHDQPAITVTYFKEDALKEGGAYYTITKRIKRIDDYNRTLIFMDHTCIPIDEIYEIALMDDVVDYGMESSVNEWEG